MRNASRVLVALALAGTAGWVGPANAADKVTIGLAVANLQADFFNQIKESVERNAKAQGIEVITVDAKGDAATQVSQIQDLLVRNVKALIYIPAGATAASVPVKAANAAKMTRAPAAIRFEEFFFIMFSLLLMGSAARSKIMLQTIRAALCRVGCFVCRLARALLSKVIARGRC